MIKKLIFLLLSISCISSFAQNNAHINYNVKGANNKVDSLPYFVYDKIELDSFLLNNKIIPIVDESVGMSIRISLSFFVDTTSKPHGIEVTNIDLKTTAMMYEKSALDSTRAYYSRESIRLIALTEGMWAVNKSNSGAKLNIVIPFVSDSYEQKKKDELKPENQRAPFMKYDVYSKNLVNGKIPCKVNNYYDLGVKKLNQGKLLIAKKYFEQAINLKHDDIDAYYNLGICYLKLKDNEHACKCWSIGQKMGDTGVQDLINKYCK